MHMRYKCSCPDYTGHRSGDSTGTRVAAHSLVWGNATRPLQKVHLPPKFDAGGESQTVVIGPLPELELLLPVWDAPELELLLLETTPPDEEALPDEEPESSELEASLLIREPEEDPPPEDPLLDPFGETPPSPTYSTTRPPQEVAARPKSTKARPRFIAPP